MVNKKQKLIPKAQKSKSSKLWEESKTTKAAREWGEKGKTQVKETSKKADDAKKELQDSDNRLRAKHGSLYDVKGVIAKQKELVKNGYDLGTTGKNKDGVDGDWGDKTEKAWKDYLAKKKALASKKITPVKKETPKKEVSKEPSPKPVTPKPKDSSPSFFSKLYGDTKKFISSIFSSEPPPPISKDKNLQSVLDHTKALNNGKTYWYADPKSKIMYLIVNGEIVDILHPGSGLNQGSDGWAPLIGGYNRDTNPSSTPAGVFTFSKNMPAPYGGGTQAKFLLYGRGNSEGTTITNMTTNGKSVGGATPVAVHYEATPGRAKGNYSFGCFNLNPEEYVKFMSASNEGDTVYVLPRVDGNYLYEDVDRRIKTHYESTPSSTTYNAWGTPTTVEGVRYNTGY